MTERWRAEVENAAAQSLVWKRRNLSTEETWAIMVTMLNRDTVNRLTNNCMSIKHNGPQLFFDVPINLASFPLKLCMRYWVDHQHHHIHSLSLSWLKDTPFYCTTCKNLGLGESLKVKLSFNVLFVCMHDSHHKIFLNFVVVIEASTC